MRMSDAVNAAVGDWTAPGCAATSAAPQSPQNFSPDSLGAPQDGQASPISYHPPERTINSNIREMWDTSLIAEFDWLKLLILGSSGNRCILRTQISY